MNADWYPGIKAFCQHWSDAPMLQKTLATLEREFADDNDACIDAAKGLIECACRVIIDELDDPLAPLKPSGTDVLMGTLVGVATRLLKLGDVRHREFADLIKHHNNLLVRAHPVLGLAPETCKDIVRAFTRRCARDALETSGHEFPPLVAEYLTTGREDLREATLQIMHDTLDWDVQDPMLWDVRAAILIATQEINVHADRWAEGIPLQASALAARMAGRAAGGIIGGRLAAIVRDAAKPTAQGVAHRVADRMKAIHRAFLDDVVRSAVLQQRVSAA